MRGFRAKRILPASLCALALTLGMGAMPAQGAFSDPLFVFVPQAPAKKGEPPVPPPTGYLEGPCGLAVDSSSNFYVSDYYHHVVDVFKSDLEYEGQIANEDPLDGPCGLALDSADNLYVNNFHRNVAKFSFLLPGPILPLAPDPAHHLPTGVAVDTASNNVYVNNRTYITVFEPSGAQVMDGAEPLRIGLGSLGDGYGLAISRFPATTGRIYVPDAVANAVKVYDPAFSKVTPVATITGPGKGFSSLRDSAVAIDNFTGNVYVADNLQPKATEKPEAAIYVFGPGGSSLGVLKYKIYDALPPGLAVDNSSSATQGRVYVTSGNTDQAGIYAYPPGAQTSGFLPPTVGLVVTSSGSGGGEISSDLGAIDCTDTCSAQIRSGATVTLTATPDSGSAFGGWSGGGCAGTGACTVAMSEAKSVSANFQAFPVAAQRRAQATAQASEITQEGVLRLSVNGKLAPHRLPRKGASPIAVSVDWNIATTDGSAVPKLKQLGIEINRNGRFDYAGLPICPIQRIQPASTSRALANCRSALVGEGSFSAIVALREQEPYATEGKLLVFNGESHGKPVLLGQIYSPHPFPTSFVITFAVKNLAHGTYGTTLEATLPKGLRSWGNLTGIEMKLSRRYAYAGKRHSYISAGCPAPKGFSKAVFPLARASFGFVGGAQLSSVFTSTCQAKG